MVVASDVVEIGSWSSLSSEKEEEEVRTEPTAPATGQAWRRFVKALRLTEWRRLAWRRFVKALRRVRRLQRIWGNVGNFLKTFPASLRDRLRETHA
jgi:hypothetical protein